jgi:phosphinothricin acetyltransferase
MYVRPELDTIRRATAGDAVEIARIYNEGIEERTATFETEPRTPEQISDLLREREQRYPTVVLERDGRLVAWAGTSEDRARPCYAGIAEFSIYVDRAARGTGAGRAALAALMVEAERAGFWKLVSRIFPENAASRALCRAVGFREVGVYRNHARLDGEWRDVIIVERLLGDAAHALADPAHSTQHSFPE